MGIMVGTAVFAGLSLWLGKIVAGRDGAMRRLREFSVAAKVVGAAFAFMEAIRSWVEWHAKGGWKAAMPNIPNYFGGPSRPAPDFMGRNGATMSSRPRI
jgi:hypothetical protein